MVMGGDSRSKGCGFESQRWMDMTFFTLICCNNCIVCLKSPKINEKEARVGPFFKKKLTTVYHLLALFKGCGVVELLVVWQSNKKFCNIYAFHILEKIHFTVFVPP